MSDFTADAETLDAQGNLHLRIAQFYRNLVEHVQAQGCLIVAEFERVQDINFASQYQLWLNTAGFEQLEQEAKLHDTWADYFFELARQVRQAENMFSIGYLV